jgi:hypothetical protein
MKMVVLIEMQIKILGYYGNWKKIFSSGKLKKVLGITFTKNLKKLLSV